MLTIRELFKDSFAFECRGRITAILPARQACRERLSAILPKIRMICGVSHSFSDIYESVHACYQAAAALDTEGNASADGISMFEDSILLLLLKNALKGVPAKYYYTEGLTRLADHDASSQVSYIDTLKAYLDNNCSIAETARALHLHRSSLIDRLGRIIQTLGCDLNDSGTRLAMQIVLHADQLNETV